MYNKLLNLNFEKYPSLKPFDKNIINFLDEFSKKLIRYNNIIKYPDLIALAYWCRKKNIYKLSKEYDFDDLVLGRGLIFHITPSNIPTNFIYSLIFGLLTGNKNIVKIPTIQFDQIKIIKKIFNNLLSLKKFKKLKNYIFLISYDSMNNLKITKKISYISNSRLIWGSDKTISDVKSIANNPFSLDITFPDRTSLCLINSNIIKNLNENEIYKLAKNFYDDTYSVDQNACSSPQILVWLGKNNLHRRKFWDKLMEIVKKKYNLQNISPIEKLTKLQKDVISYDVDNKKIINDPYLTVLPIKNMSNIKIENLRSNSGYFYEFNISSIKYLMNNLSNKFQTLTYFGLKKDFLEKNILLSKKRSVNRIVPVGKALDISLMWDGYDIINILTKKIKID